VRVNHNGVHVNSVVDSYAGATTYTAGVVAGAEGGAISGGHADASGSTDEE